MKASDGRRIALPALLVAMWGALLFSASPASAVTSYHALLVGPHYPGGPAFDDTVAGTRMTNLATEMGEWNNWKPANITTLVGAVTEANVNAAIAAKQAAVDADDVFLFIYHGHGTHSNGNAGETSLTAADEDFALPNGDHLLDDEFGPLIKGFNNNATKLAIALSCFGGGMWGGGDGDLGAGVEPRTAFYAGAKENQNLGEPPAFYTNMFNAIKNENVGSINIQQWYNASKANGSIFSQNWNDTNITGFEEQNDFDSVLQYTSSDVLLDELFVVPEPTGLVLAAMGLLTLGGCGWRRSRAGIAPQ